MSRREGDTTLTAMDRAGPPPPVVELEAGTRIGRFVVERRLGAGGMGVVYAARDTALARDVALKVVRPRGALDAMQARLTREAQAMARLHHPNVVEVFEIGSHEGQLFITMELIAGDTLRAWVRDPRPWRAVVTLFIRAGRALDAAHAAGLVHRDFKPDNVVVGPDGEPQITDFGLARELDDPGVATPVGPAAGELPQLTATGTIAGTPGYMAPEQLAGERGGAAADQFSFCVSLFEVLYGARPFQAPPDQLYGAIRARRIATPERPRLRVPGWLRAVIVRGLAFDPAQRWPSLRALVEALERGRRRRGRAMIGLAAAAAVAAAATGTLALRGGATAAPRCLDVAEHGNEATTVLVCQQEYVRTGDPSVGSKLADALRRAGKLEEAAIVANELLATRVGGDALYTLGKIARVQHRLDEAERLFRMASERHRSQQRWDESAADLHAIAGVSRDAVEKLAVLDQAVVDARRGSDGRTEAFCHLLAADVLSQIGARACALAELDRAAPLLSRPEDVAHLQLMRGNVYQNLGEQPAAVAAFENAISRAVGVSAQVAWSARFNLVYSLAEAGQLTDATRALAAARALDGDGELTAIGLALEARIARHSGNTARATDLIERAAAATEDADDQLFDRETERAEIALDAGDLGLAEQAARRAIARGEKLAPARPPAMLRSWLITDHRAPHDLLFLALARRGDASGALIAFEHRRGLDVLAGLAHGDAPPPPSSDGVGFPAVELGRWLPPLGASALAAPPADAAAVEAARAGPVLVLVVARNELWRITGDVGQLAIDRVGELAALRPQFDQLRADPSGFAATALGEQLVPAALAVRSDRALRVVLDEPLAGLPVAALRLGDRRLVGMRPVVLAARVSDTACAPHAAGDRRTLAIDDAAVPHARAMLLGTARGDRVYVAARTEIDALGASLILRDGPVRALEVAGHAGIAGQVVLVPGPDASPAAGIALALAFLAAGSDQVIAPVAAVSPAATRRVVDQLTRSDDDLLRLLARLQTSAGGDGTLGFAVFGRDTCHPPR